MKIVAIISLVIFTYAVFCVLRESIRTIKAKNDIGEHHLEIHLSILIMFLITSLSFVGWLFWHNGFFHGFQEHLIKESLWFFMMLLSYSITTITRHFRKERLGEEFILDIKKEIKYKR